MPRLSLRAHREIWKERAVFPKLAEEGVILHNRLLNMAHYLSQNWLLGRRHVLRGLGASLALPMLD